jgi:hypothetical protein
MQSNIAVRYFKVYIIYISDKSEQLIIHIKGIT